MEAEIEWKKKIYEYNMLNKKVKNKIKDIVKIRKE